MVLPEIFWANYFGRRSLGTVRGLGILISQALAAVGPPFFGFLFDLTHGYGLSFAHFWLCLDYFGVSKSHAAAAAKTDTDQ